MNTCATTLGSRMLAKWLRFPLRDREDIHRRQQAVEVLATVGNRGLHKQLQCFFKRVGNISVGDEPFIKTFYSQCLSSVSMLLFSVF